MKIDQIVIAVESQNFALRCRNNQGGTQTVVVPIEKLGSVGAQALQDLVLALQPFVPADVSSEKQKQIDDLETQLNVLRSEIGLEVPR